MKKILTLAALAALSIGVQANEGSVAAPAEKKVEAPVAAAPVAKLSAEETQFAGKLNERHRKVFTEKFTAQQRKAVMAATAASADKKALSADEAVQKVMSENKVTLAEKCDSTCEAKK